MGPPLASGWNWAVKTGLVECIMPWKIYKNIQNVNIHIAKNVWLFWIVQFNNALHTVAFILHVIFLDIIMHLCLWPRQSYRLKIIVRKMSKYSHLIGAIIGVNKQGAPPRGQGLAVDAVAVVLCRNECLACHYIHNWLVLASVEHNTSTGTSCSSNGWKV